MAARIRLARESDAGPIGAIYGPVVEATAISFETVPPAEEEIARRIAATLPAYPWLVCDVADRVAGYAYATQHRARAAYRWSVDVSVYVDPVCRRSGVGRGLYVSLFAILSAQGYFSAFAGITLPNPASIGLHESMGFTKVGVYHRVGYKLRAWHDVGWWERTLRTHAPSPAEPLLLAVARARGDWNALLASGESVIRPPAP